MKKEFSLYEFVDVIAPGSVLLIILVQLFPNSLKILKIKEISLGGFGIFVIISYVLGHLIQTVGNVIESIWYKIYGGIPSSWIIREGKCDYLNSEQIKLIPEKIKKVLNIETKDSLYDYDCNQWFAITRQIYSAVKQENATERIDIFDANYGFFRGIASSFAIGLVVLTIKTGFAHYDMQLIILAFFIMAIVRMHRFAKHYAQELFVQFLQLKE